MLNKFTSTGLKIIHHPEVIKKLQQYGMGTPISAQLAPTAMCNLRCSFCSNAKRTLNEYLDPKDVMEILSELKHLGLKTLEITGGGDPTMYGYINDIIEYAHKIGLQQGFITNGILLKKRVSQKNIDRLSWLRISMNCLDYVDNIDIPDFKGTLGFSYVMNDKTAESDVLYRLDNAVIKYNPKYVRIVPNCLATPEQQKINNKIYSEKVARWGKPYFYQVKEFNQPDHCYWCYFKPFILHDGYVYPCSSVVLNSGASGKFHEKYRWIKMSEFADVYKKPMVPFSTKKCNCCVFKNQNDLINMALNPVMENFV